MALASIPRTYVVLVKNAAHRYGTLLQVTHVDLLCRRMPTEFLHQVPHHDEVVVVDQKHEGQSV